MWQVVSILEYCELWLEFKGNLAPFRVALAAPQEFETPEEFEEREFPDLQPKRYFVSEWFDSIDDAKNLMNETAQFYSDRSAKYLFFRELRKPLVE
jgi:chromosome condensin MukBEF complex kleisin-like MukF subunit